MNSNKETSTFFAIFMYLGAVLLIASTVGGSLPSGRAGLMALILLLIGIGFTGAAMRAGRNETGASTALAVTDSLTLPGSSVQPAPEKEVQAPAEPEPTPVVEEVAPPAPASVIEEEPAETTKPDDLTKIEGIGPKMAEALTSGGVTTYGKLAEMSIDDIRAVLEEQGQRFAPSAESWAEQASYAAKGDWDGLDTLQDTLVSGRYPTDDA